MITVNSISFSNSLRPSQPATNRLVGNAGDVVVATINLTTTATLNDFIFYVNCVPNNTQLYNSPLVGDLFSSVFNSLTNNADQFYTRNGGVIAPASPRSFDNSNSIVVNSLGGFVYEIVHTFVLAPILRENELDNDIFSNPSYYSNNGLKYVFKLDSINDGITLETTDDVNLETLTIIRNGSVSGWGSSLGTGAINYNLVVAPNLIDINSNQITTHIAQIKKLSGAWLITDLISYRLQAISEISGYDFTQSLLQNTKFDFVTHNVGAAAQNGANGFILDCFCEINAIDNTLLDITFSIVNNYSNEFSVFFACSSDVVGFEHQNVLATYGTAIAQGSNSQVEFVNYAGFNSDFRIGFINWYNQTFIDEGFNHLRAYRKDDNEVFFGVRLVDIDARFVSLNCGFKNLDTNQFLTNETFNFDFTTSLPLQVDRGYIRKDDNPKKYIQVAYVGDRYEFRYGFNVGSEFLVSSNIVFEANVNFVDSNGFVLTNTIRSPFLEIGQYDVTQNTIAEPQVLANPIPQPKFYIVDEFNTPNFGTEYDGIIAGQNMLIVATFQDNNLNDLQANEIDLAGFFAITTPNEIKGIERYFFSTYQSETDTPFQAINGHTAGLVKITKIDVKTVTLSAIINYQRLIAAFPNTRDLCIVSRIDKPQPPSFAYFKDISLHFTSSPSGDTLITNPATQNWINQEFVFDSNHVAADFQFKINPTGATTKSDASWGLVPYLDLATFEATPVLSGYTVRVECIDLKGKTDILGCITYTSLIPTAIPFSGTHFRSAKTALTDFIAFYKEDLSIVSLTSLNTLRFQAVRNNSILNLNSNLTNFIAFNLVTLNADLAASPQKYAHYHLSPTTLANNTTTITGNFGAANREVVEYISPSKYDFAPFLTNPNAIKGDGVNDLLYVPAGATGGNLLYPSNMTVGEERSYTWLGMQNAMGNYDVIGSGQSEYIRYLGSSNFLLMRIGANEIFYGFSNIEGFSTINTPVKYITYTIRRNAATGTAATAFTVNLYVNGRLLTQTSAVGAIAVNTFRFGAVNFNLGMLNGISVTSVANSFRNQNLNYFAMHKRILTTEEIRKIHLGNSISSFLPNYYYDFTNLVVSGLNRTSPNLGSDAILDAKLENHTNLLTPLFP